MPLVRRALLSSCAVLCAATSLVAQDRTVIRAEDLRPRLFAIADDSMAGRATGTRGNWLTAEYVAAEFRRFGLEPAGDSGTYFQTVPIRDRSGSVTSLPFAARNVVGVLRGSDPRLRATYIAITAHNDHIGIRNSGSVDHDSLRAFNRVVRPMGADSRNRPATPDEAARIQALRDSLGRDHAARRDSIYNGADDDGSGTVALIEIARAMAAGRRPRRSIVFVSHAAEERGLLGAMWYTDHPTLPRDSLLADIDIDMIGRGTAQDLPNGGNGYIEVVGSRRLSTEFGNILETVNGQRARGRMTFSYEYDAAGHPAQYYCRADHYGYARYGIPSVSLSTGLHLDYHQLTDEPQYIDYAVLANVSNFVKDVALAVANLDHRPVIDGPRQDPNAPCRQ